MISKLRSILLGLLVLAAAFVKGQAPNISYGGPKVYTVGTAILPLAPVNSGGAVNVSLPVTLSKTIKSPVGVAIDKAGNAYIADEVEHARITKLPAGGGAPVSLPFNFTNLLGIAVDFAGNIYVSSGSKIQKVTPAGTVSDYITYKRGGIFYSIAADSAANIYAGDLLNGTVTKFPANGGRPTVIASGFGNNTISGVAVDSQGTVYFVVEQPTNSLVESISPGSAGPSLICTLREWAVGIAVDAQRNLYVTSRSQNSIVKIPFGSTTPITFASGLNEPAGIAADAGGNLYFTQESYPIASVERISEYGFLISPALPDGLSFDKNTGTISGTPIALSPAASYTVTATNASGSTTATVNLTVGPSGKPNISYSSPPSYITGTAISPLAPVNTGSVILAATHKIMGNVNGLSFPHGLTVDKSGNVYVANTDANSIIEIPIDGGTSFELGSGFKAPTDVAVDSLGNLFIADQGNGAIKEIPTGSNNIMTIAAAPSPYSLTLDRTGNIYFSDQSNNAVEKISAGSSSPVIIATGMGAISGIALDLGGNIYVAGAGTVKEIPAGGGSLISLATGTSDYAMDVTVDKAGNIYLALPYKNEITKIPAGGGTPAVLLTENYPGGLALDASGNMYIIVEGGYRIVKLANFGLYSITPDLPAGLRFDINTGIISGTPTVASPSTNYTVTANNSGGADSVLVNITVNALLKPNIKYSNPLVFTAGTAISPLMPVNIGGKVLATPPAPVILPSLGDLYLLTSDAKGNVYGVGYNGLTKIPAGGGPPVSTGSGNQNETGIAVDTAGNFYAAYAWQNQVIKFPVGGGSAVSLGSGFNHPIGIAVDKSGNIYIADSGNNLVKKIPVGSNTPITIGTEFEYPSAVAVDAVGNVYVEDGSGIQEIQVSNGNTVKIPEPNDGSLSGLAVDSIGDVYSINTPTNSVIEIPVKSSNYITVASGLNNPTGLAVDQNNNVYIGEGGSDDMKEVKYRGFSISPILPAGLNINYNTGVISGTPTTASTLTTYSVVATNAAGNGTAEIKITVNLPDKPNISYSSPQVYGLGMPISPLSPVNSGGALPVPVPIILASVDSHNLIDAAVDNEGNVYVADYDNDEIKKIPAGGGAAEIFYSVLLPLGVAVDAVGNVYVTSVYATGVTKIPVGGGAKVTIGSGLSGPRGVAVDKSGNIYVGDGYGLKKIPAGSNTPLVIGTFPDAAGIAVDAAGNVYVADGDNNAIKKILAANGNTITLSKGSGRPSGIAVDSNGNVYFTDDYLTSITEIPLAGGSNIAIGSGFREPMGVSINANNIYICDAGNQEIKEITYDYNISPVLPNGLTFDYNTGIIGGTPAAASPPTNYTVTATNAGGTDPTVVNIGVIQSSTSLASLTINPGTLSPLFNSATANYTIAEPYSQTSVNVTPTTADATSTVTVNGVGVTSGSPSGAIALSVGPNTITTKVTAQDGSFFVYTITVTRSAPSTDASLYNLALGWNLSPAFNPTITSYTANVTNATTSIAITPTTADAHATVTVNGTPVLSTSRSAPIALNIGANVITALVTAQDGATKTYTVTVNRGANGGAALSNLFISSGTLSPSFNYLTTGYNASVSNATTSLTVTPVAADITGVVTVNGTVVASRTASAPISLAPGPNTITIVATAGGKPNGTYILIITRAQPSENASLANLHLSSGTLSPAFVYTNTHYTANVANTTASITLTPTAADPNATVTVNGTAVPTGTVSAPVSLGFGTNTVTILVTTPDGTLNNSYTLIITRAQPSQNAALAFLKLSSGTLSPAFVYTNADYTATVDNTTASITVTPITGDANAMLTVNGMAVPSGSASGDIALSVGANTITTVVTAQNGINTKTYTVTVTRAAGGVNAYAAGISVSNPAGTPGLADDHVVVHAGISPNGDGINDFLVIDGILAYPDNKLSVMDRNGQLIYEAKGYNNSAKVFDGHSGNGRMQLPGTYFYQLEYTAGGIVKYKTGYLVLKY